MLGRSIGSIPALCGAGLVLVVLSVVIGSTAHGQAPARVDRLSFRHQVAPILVKKCLGCHHERKASGGLSMATFASLRRGGKMAGETILEPGDPDDSALIESVREGAAPRMPYKLPPLTQDEIATLSRWVKEGAEFDGPSVAETPLASLVDRLAGLPKIALKVPVGDPITSVTFSIDGQALAAAVGRQVVLYDPESGKVVATMGDHPGPVNSVSFSPDGTSLIAAGGRAGLFGSVTVWDRSKRERRLELKGHSDSILWAVFTADGKGLATAGYDKQILIWDLVRGTVIRSLKDHSDAVYGLA
ncbi:MAG TPA: c-type cytochrome domain-containing protein, partial [Isosphaeraceae bacterium]|nr:c-type cytochrome domain-containing protein [Isosphaeraceae bacterium]